MKSSALWFLSTTAAAAALLFVLPTALSFVVPRVNIHSNHAVVASRSTTVSPSPSLGFARTPPVGDGCGTKRDSIRSSLLRMSGASSAVVDGSEGEGGKKGFLGRVKSILPPKAERQKLGPLALMFFCILFSYTILRDTKDVLMVTAPKSGAEGTCSS